MTNLVPYLSKAASDSWDVEEYQDAGVQVTENALLWTMGGYSFHNEWDYPTVLQALEGNDTWTEKQRVFQLPEADKWVYMAISSVFAADHPIHLHGHDFWILDQGFGTWNNQTSNFVLENSPRRDVAMLPASGHLVIAFKTDNPGVSHSRKGAALPIIILALCMLTFLCFLGLAVALPHRMAHVRGSCGPIPGAGVGDGEHSWCSGQ